MKEKFTGKKEKRKKFFEIESNIKESNTKKKKKLNQVGLNLIVTCEASRQQKSGIQKMFFFQND